MTIDKILLIICCASLLTGCATTQKQLSRKEWLQVRNHHYTNVSSEEILNTAEQIFKLADNKDFNFSYNNNSLKDVRWAAPFPVHIWYHWNIETESKGGDTYVNVSISTTAHGLGVPGGMTSHDSPDVIRLFYSRLDYLLGKDTCWKSCDEYKSDNPQTSTLEALCLLAKDLPPNTLKKHP